MAKQICQSAYRKFHFCILLIFLAIAQDAFSNLILCQDFLRQENFSFQESLANQRLSRVHLASQQQQAFSKQMSADLDLEWIYELFAPRLKTNFGRARLNAALNEPLLESKLIRAIQEASKEIHSNSFLRSEIEMIQKELSDFENRNLLSDKILKWFMNLFNIKAPLQPRSFPEAIKQLENMDSNFFQKIAPFIIMLLYPVSQGATYYSSVYNTEFQTFLNQHPNMSFTFALLLSLYPVAILTPWANSLSFMVNRNVFRHFKFFLKRAEKFPAVLDRSQSPYLRELGATLKDILDSDSEEAFTKVSRSLKRTASFAPLVRLIDFTGLSNYSLIRLQKNTKLELKKFILVASIVAELDLLLFFSHLQDREYTYPEILDGHDMHIQIKAGHHPIILERGQNSVVNDYELGMNATPSIRFITGPNARGKTTYVRMIALNILLAQMGAPVPAKAMSLNPVQLLTSIRNLDSIQESDSLFKAEGRKVARLLKQAQEFPRSLLIFDEVFSGTSPEEKIAAERALISYLSRHSLPALITSHNRDLVQLEGKLPNFANFHMSDDDSNFFQLENGFSKRRNAFEVLRELGLPADLMDEADSFLSSP